MLRPLVAAAGLGSQIKTILSVDARKIYKRHQPYTTRGGDTASTEDGDWFCFEQLLGRVRSEVLRFSNVLESTVTARPVDELGATARSCHRQPWRPAGLIRRPYHSQRAFPSTEFLLQVWRQAGAARAARRFAPPHICDNAEPFTIENPLVVWVRSGMGRPDPAVQARDRAPPRTVDAPRGFMELGETIAQAALRETLEEAKARVELGEVFRASVGAHVDRSMFSTVPVCSTAISRRARKPWEVGLFPKRRFPGSKSLSRTISTTLRHFYATASGTYGFTPANTAREVTA